MELSGQRQSSCSDILKASKPSKLMLIVLNRPQLPLVCLSEATWRQLCFSALSNHCTVLWLMVSICWSHILSFWTKLLSLNYMDGVWPCPELTTLWGWLLFRKQVSYFWRFWRSKMSPSLKEMDIYTDIGRTWHFERCLNGLYFAENHSEKASVHWSWTKN